MQPLLKSTVTTKFVSGCCQSSKRTSQETAVHFNQVKRQFPRVLELPSENWLELAQDWCFHGGSQLKSAAGALEPGEKDCFVGECYIKLLSSTLQPGSVQILPGVEHHFLKCCRCNSMLESVGAEDLWLFNADTAVLTNVENSKTAVKTGIYSIQNKAKYLRVLKILYKIKPFFSDSDWDDEVDRWREDSSVQPLSFAKETCRHLILLLAQSTNTIAPSLRDMNGFKVGYLRTLTTKRLNFGEFGVVREGNY